jgi:N-acetylglucosamine kinase-like BadF-type ATPase
MKYYLGVDVGSTKTAALIADEYGNPIGDCQSGSGNHETVGFDGMQAALCAAMDGAIQDAKIQNDQIAGAGFGIAGLDWSAEVPAMEKIINHLGLSAPYRMVNDAVLGLLAGTSESWGLTVVSGTGCNCRGWDKDHKREGRVTGHGVLMGENAGASELIIHAMQIVNHSWIKRLPPTALADAFIKYVNAKNLEDLIEGYTSGTYAIGADAAFIVFDTAAQGDALAQEIIKWAGVELGELANAVIRQLNFESLEFEIALIGSMFKGGEALIAPMRATIHALAPKAQLIVAEVKPVVGAVLLGMEAGGLKLTLEQRIQIKKGLTR